jgi:hypothetical protein
MAAPLFSPACFAPAGAAGPDHDTVSVPAPVETESRPFSSLAAFFGAALTSFTVSLVGEMPVGELILMGVVGWIVLHIALEHSWPSPLFERRWFWFVLGAQALGLAAYVVSDLLRGSAPHDMLRGWARMVFLAIDTVAVACLLGRSARNFLVFALGLQVGFAAQALLFGALFGDLWKFGIGVPITFAVLGVAAFGGPLVAVTASVVMCLVHFTMDYRSVGAVCMLVAVLTGVQACPRPIRRWLVPLGIFGAIAAVAGIYAHSQSDREGNRAGRSDVDRTAMIQAAVEGFVESPVIGNGSWFSNSDVLDNYLYIRADLAQEAGIGGFAGPNEDVGELPALHSQILVALAEGGVFGGTFFIVFFGALIWALYDQVLVADWRRESPLRLMVLIFALINILFSPFSGAHRVHIALGVGLVLLIHSERLAAREAELAEPEEGRIA